MGVSWSRFPLFPGKGGTVALQGIPASSLQAEGTRRSGSVYHTIGDTMKIIEPDALERVVNTAVQVVRCLDA
jgi:hypothetical protein